MYLGKKVQMKRKKGKYPSYHPTYHEQINGSFLTAFLIPPMKVHTGNQFYLYPTQDSPLHICLRFASCQLSKEGNPHDGQVPFFGCSCGDAMGFPGKNLPAMQKMHMGWEFNP